MYLYNLNNMQTNSVELLPTTFVGNLVVRIYVVDNFYWMQISVPTYIFKYIFYGQQLSIKTSFLYNNMFLQFFRFSTNLITEK